MEKLNLFIEEQRSRFVIEQNNKFASSWSKVSRRLKFLELIAKQHQVSSAQYIAVTRRLNDSFLPGSHTATEEQRYLMNQSRELGDEVHMQIESGYLFSKIILDDIARAIEYYFGAGRNLSLDSHDGLTKNIQFFADLKKIILTKSFIVIVNELKNKISDFRDYQISHEKSPRTVFGSILHEKGVIMSLHQIYTKENEVEGKQSMTPDDLYNLITDYINQVVQIIIENQDRTNLKLDKVE